MKSAYKVTVINELPHTHYMRIFRTAIVAPEIPPFSLAGDSHVDVVVEDEKDYLYQFKEIKWRLCQSEAEYAKYPGGIVTETKPNPNFVRPEEVMPNSLQLEIDFTWCAEHLVKQIGTKEFGLLCIPGLKYVVFDIPITSFLARNKAYIFHEQNMRKIPSGSWGGYNWKMVFPNISGSDGPVNRPAPIRYSYARGRLFNLRKYPQAIRRSPEELMKIEQIIRAL